MSQKSKILLCASIVFAILAFTANGASLLHKRSSDSETTTTATSTECQSNTPCGWAVYAPFTRKIENFVKNTCDCPSELACIRNDDDLAVSAFVYRCRNIKNNETSSS